VTVVNLDPLWRKPNVQALVADDDSLTREIVSKPLARWGFDVSVVEDGAAAWERLRDAQGATLAILDWMMPHMDGPQICRRLRAERPQANIYVILLTALESRRDLVAGLDAGADDYVVKPCDHEELRARVQVGRRVLTLQDRLAERVVELQDALASVKHLHGLLPICCYCKRIRGDDKYWQQVEAYISERSAVQFSHGICPPCLEVAKKELELHAARRKA
jgi:sigma-B regulation protein RsbU (phosphoserine phosphatase)